MAENGSSPPDRLAEFAAEVREQVENLCEIEDHITSVISNLDIDEDWFEGYENPDRAWYDLVPMVRMFLYREARGFNDSQLERRLEGAPVVYIRCELKDAPRQQTIGYNWTGRFNLAERQAIMAVAEEMREVCADHGLIHDYEPALDPEDLNDADEFGKKQIQKAVKIATELGFDEFSADRASNAKYPLEAYFERQGFLNMSDMDTTSPRRLFSYVSDREEVPHGSSHNRTMKKVGDPDSQTTLSDYESGGRPLDWKRIRDEILPAFHAGVEKQLDEIAGRDRQELREPLMAAIDIVTFNFWPSPFRPEEDVAWDEEPVISKSGREVYPKEDYPEMVSGFKDPNKEKAERGYKFATLTIVAENTPLILAIEPVRDERWWEKVDDDVDVERTPRGDVVDRLLEQATDHVDIHKVFCDREFDAHAVRDVIDRRNIQYVNGKVKRSNADYENIKEVSEDPVYDTRIEHAECWHEGRMHKVSIVYKPGGEYSLFTLNGWVDHHRAEALIGQYRHRWTIENEYKTIKEHYLPPTASKDYRIRFLYFVIAVILYNIWRLANFVVRDEVDAHLGESPPLPASEILILLSRYLFDPGD